MNTIVYKFLSKQVRPIELANLIKKSLFIRRREIAINEFTFYIDPVSDLGIRLLTEACYEPDMTEKILHVLELGDTFIDLGANEGYFSIVASKKIGKSGKVYCIEPQERLWSIILKNLQLNEIYNVQLIPYAASDKKEISEMILTPSVNTGSSGLVKSGRNRIWAKQRIVTTTLDELINSNVKVKLLKVDIEGFEFFALRGAESILRNGQIENLIIELHPQQLKLLGHSEVDINAFLSGLGYVFRHGVYKLNPARKT